MIKKGNKKNKNNTNKDNSKYYEECKKGLESKFNFDDNKYYKNLEKVLEEHKQRLEDYNQDSKYRKERLEELFDLDDSKFYKEGMITLEKLFGGVKYNDMRHLQLLEKFEQDLEYRKERLDLLFDRDDSKFYEKCKRRLDLLFDDFLRDP